MRLHLPKALLAAVLAACLAWPAGAEGEDTPTPTTVTVTQQSDLTTNQNQLKQDVSSLGVGDLLIFDAPGSIYLPNGDKTMPMNIEFEQDFLIQNGFGDKTYTFSGALISEAGITATMTPDVSNTYNFSGNLENFKGSLVFNNKITANFRNVGTVGAKSISLAGSTTITGTFSTSGSLTSTGTLTNNGTLTIGGSYTGRTITQDSSASLVLSNDSIVNLDSIAATNNLTNTEKTGVQAYSKSWTLVSGGSLTDNGAIYKLGGNELTGGSMSLSSGTFTSATSYYCYNVASGTSKSYSEVTDAIGTETVDLINVLGTLTGISANTNNYSITGNGRVTITGELGYDSDETNSFLNSFVGVVEVANGGNLKLGSTNNRLSNANKIVVTAGGIINLWTGGSNGLSNAKVGTTAALELAGGTLGTSGGSLQYNGEIIVTDSSYMGVNGRNLTLKNTVKAENGVITTNGTVKHTGEWDMSGQEHNYTSSLKIASGTFESAGLLWGTSNSTQILIEEGANFKKGNFTFAGKSGADSSITFGATGLLGVDGGHTVANTAVTYAGSADATDATILGMNLGNGSTLTVTSGKLQVSGTNTLARMDINGGETTISGSTEVTGTVSVANSSQVILTSGANLTNSGFTFTGQSGDTSSTITFGATGAFAVSDAHTVANTSVTYAGSADATDATVLGMNLGDGSALTVTSGKLQVSGTNTLARIALNGGETTLTGATAVTGIKGDGIIAASDTIKLTVSDTGTLTHDGFQYTGTELSGLKKGLSMWNGNDTGGERYNVLVSGGSITQTDNTKKIYAKLSDVKLINTVGKTSALGVDAELSGASIGGTLRVGRDDMTWNEATQQYDKRVLEKVTVTVSGKADVTGEVKIETGSTFKLTGQDTTSSIATLTGSGTLKTTGGKTKVATATGFTGTLAATGGNIELQSATALALSEVVVSGGSSISGAESYTADKVSIGAGAAGSLVGSLSINTNGTITLDASAGATTETGGTKGLSLSALTTTFADEGSTSTTVSLTLGSGLTLNLLNLNVKQGDSLTLFSGVTSAVYGDGTTALTADGIEANTVFSNLTEGDFKLSYSNNIVALVAQRDVPEPTTATLSLLALMGLAARRRRRKA